MATMKDIAKLANTSLGTVDRALNDKPGVSPKTRQRILELAESLHYTTNKHGKALVLKRRNTCLGCIVEPLSNPYFQDLKRGLEEAGKELEDCGITTHILEMTGYDEDEQIACMERLREQNVSGIVMNAIRSERMISQIDRFVEQGIRIVTCNTDCEHSKRDAFVGVDNEQMGRLAAELLAKLMGRSGSALVVTGFANISAHTLRDAGFRRKIAESYHNISVVAGIESHENDAIAEQNTLKALAEHPDISGIFVAGYGVLGVIAALEKQNKSESVRVICCDHTPITDALMRADKLDAILCQDAVQHGFLSLKTLGDMVMYKNAHPGTIHLTNIEIRLQENLNSTRLTTFSKTEPVVPTATGGLRP